MSAGYVYMAIKDGDDCVKIGRTAFPSSRYPKATGIKIIWKARVNNCEKMESLLHAMFRSKRRKGNGNSLFSRDTEWFYLDDHDADVVKKTVLENKEEPEECTLVKTPMREPPPWEYLCYPNAEWVTPTQAAAYLGMSTAMYINLQKDYVGKLDKKTVGRNRLFLRSDIERIWQEREQEGK